VLPLAEPFEAEASKFQVSISIVDTPIEARSCAGRARMTSTLPPPAKRWPRSLTCWWRSRAFGCWSRLVSRPSANMSTVGRDGGATNDSRRQLGYCAARSPRSSRSSPTTPASRRHLSARLPLRKLRLAVQGPHVGMGEVV